LLRSYVAGETPTSLAAIRNLRQICANNLGGRFKITVVDLRKNPTLARDHQIVALPTLVRRSPPPLRRMVGDLSDVERVLVSLDIQPRQ
jgi:circadian clock protein KaiB